MIFIHKEMLKKIIFIKLGGGLISDKTTINKANLKMIEALSLQIKEVVKNNKYSLILATGAGGYGHPVAKKYIHDLKKGRPLIKKAVKEINNIVVAALKERGLNAISVEPSAITEYKNNKLMYFFDKLILSWLNSDIIPVFHADLVEDKELGTTILSMDKYLADLAIHLKQKGFTVDRVIFAGTTDGVLGYDGKVITKIADTKSNKIDNVFFEGPGVDVSGGMKKKVEWALHLSRSGILSYIIQGLKITDIVLKNKLTGTEILPINEYR
ncbi:MAG: isopentenyl phosphate kinase [Actinobacteria bacterium]|nr:isopentenyl phosphate kinase [Actinomycetota bacterium]